MMQNCVPDKEISFHHVPYVEDENEGGGQLVFFRSLHDTMAVASNESVSKLNGFRDNLQNLWRGKASLVYTWRHLLAPVLSLARGCRSWREGSCMYGKVGNCGCTVSWQLYVLYGMVWCGMVWWAAAEGNWRRFATLGETGSALAVADHPPG